VTQKALIDSGVPTTLDDATATRLGLKQYIGGVNVTVTSSNAVTASRYVFIPYQMQDGSWRCKFQISVQFTTNQTSNTFTVTGLTFKNVVNAFYQSGSTANASAPAAIQCICDNNANTIRIFSASAANHWGASGDAELESKPTWAS
jgi:hypothetical protein